MHPKKDGGIFSPGMRPTLDDVLNEKAPAPYTLAAYTAFLSQQHCLETLEFVTEAKKYASKYYEYAAEYHGMPLTTETSEGFELQQDWIRILDVYVKPGAPREINLPAEVRDDLVEEPYEPRPPFPEALEPAIKRMRDLMSDSIFIPFCNSVKAPQISATYGSASDFSEARSVSQKRQSTRKSPPTSSGQPLSSSPPHPSSRTSTQSRNAQARLSQHISSTSVLSESALTDDSSGSPHPPEDAPFSPPLTPPTSEIPQGFTSPHNIPYAPGTKPTRSESGGWKRMTRQFFGNKKKTPPEE